MQEDLNNLDITKKMLHAHEITYKKPMCKTHILYASRKKGEGYPQLIYKSEVIEIGKYLKRNQEGLIKWVYERENLKPSTSRKKSDYYLRDRNINEDKEEIKNRDKKNIKV